MGSLNILSICRRLVIYRSIFYRRFGHLWTCLFTRSPRTNLPPRVKNNLTVQSRAVPSTWLLAPDYALLPSGVITISLFYYYLHSLLYFVHLFSFALMTSIGEPSEAVHKYSARAFSGLWLWYWWLLAFANHLLSSSSWLPTCMLSFLLNEWWLLANEECNRWNIATS